MDTVQISRPTIPNDLSQINEVFYRGFLAAHASLELGITAADIEEFFRLKSAPEELARYTKHLANLPPEELFLIARDGKKVVGVCRAVIRKKFNQLQAIYILPEYHRQGIGTRLWLEAQNFFDPDKDTIVQVATYNAKAIAFYRSLGFIDTGKRFTEERHRMPFSGVLIPEMEMRLGHG